MSDQEITAAGVAGDASQTNAATAAQSAELQQKLAQLSEEARKLEEMQAELSKEQEENQESKEDVDARSIYVGNVEYAATPEDLSKHFKPCGTINRINIMMDKWGSPKGYAYIEFAEPEIVAHALLLNESEFFGRQIKVLPKRANIPGFNARGRGRGRGRGGRGSYRGGFRGRGRYNPY